MFVHNSLQPLPRLYSCKRPLNAMQVYSHSNGEGELANFREFMEKNTTFQEHPVYASIQFDFWQKIYYSNNQNSIDSHN